MKQFLKNIPVLGFTLVLIKRFLVKPTLVKDNHRSLENMIRYLFFYDGFTSKNKELVDITDVLKYHSYGILLKKEDDGYHKNVLPIFNNKEVYFAKDPKWDSAEAFFMVGLGYSYKSFLQRLYFMNKSCYIFEENFLRSVVPVSMSKEKSIDSKFFRPISYLIDSRGPHFYPGIISSLEKSINSEYKLTKEELALSGKMIKKIVNNCLSKYNCQEEKKPNLPENGRKRILLVDQVYLDYSVVASGGCDESFKYMLNKAIEDNPDSDLIIKTHVDKYSRDTYFTKIDLPKNVILYTENINPLSIIKAVDKVYTYSSTMGFEALLCGKDVHTFGSPIYAGWGVTNDHRSFSNRRGVKRSLEELFYFIYIKNSIYIDPIKEELTDIETAIDCLLEMRKEFFEREGKVNEEY